MKRILLLCLAVFGLTMCTLALPVNPETATTIAARYMGTHDLQLTATYRMDNGIAAFYVFNTSDGFVIVAADDCETPIIGYSHEGRFDPNNVPIQLEGFLQDFAERIQYGIENHIVADAITIKQWESVKTTGKLTDSKSAKSVPALLTSKWHQGCLYNSLCPTMQGPCDHAEVGCVAVAMAQIMHYWGYPTTGWGSHSYSNGGITLSADFGNTTYDWEHMPDSLTENSSEAEIEAVATLLYHCGVAVEMSYGVNGSTSTSKKIPDALIRYFNYSKHIHREKRSDFSDEEWLTLIKNSLDSLRPVQYSGFGVGIGHAFVCDGYDENDLLHFNWGWGGNYFYSSNNKQYYNAFYLYCYDLDRKMLIDSTHMHMQFTLCSYDAENDGFWLCNSYYDKHIILKDRQSQTLINGPTLTLHDDPCGLGVITATDGTRHLLILDQQGGISDYDISNNSLNKHPHLNVQGSFTGASMGKYEGKDAMFVVTNNYYATNSAVHIYEINHHLPQIIGYRIHRSDNEGQTVILADEVTNTSFIDSTWNEINAGTYRFGISEVYANGNESEIIWSDTIVKSGIGINEHPDIPLEQAAQKMFENGQIVIIKDGKRYNISGQRLN